MRIAFLLVSLLTGFSVHSQQNSSDEDAAALQRSEKALTDVIVHDIFSPPVASRIYLYANVAAYEVLRKEYTEYRSLYGQVKDFPLIPDPKLKIYPPLAAVYAFLLTGKKLVFSEAILQDSIKAILGSFSSNSMAQDVFESSLQYGKLVFEAIDKWISSDGYNETRKLRRYKFLKEEGKWIPTPPGYMAAVEPNWDKIRTLVMDSATQFRPAVNTSFSKVKGSQFYQEAIEVYETGNKLTNEQKAIANFWDCNPFFLNTDGHLNYAIKKISPGGHWISIVSIVCRQTHADIMRSSYAFTLSSVAMFDAFISCWEEKYRSNLIRPETYIDRYIDESWRPLLQTPPFPEYTSGHSVISSAASIVLTSLFGDHFAFDDTSEKEFGLPARHFNSFIDAANEAAISRLYGGIHYRPSVERGQLQGRKVGELVLSKIRWTR